MSPFFAQYLKIARAMFSVERRLGTSAAGVLVVLLSVLYATHTFFGVLPLAGILLAPSAVWLSIASVLTW